MVTIPIWYDTWRTL